MKYSMLYDGGLGDFILRMFEGGGYATLNNLQPGDICDIHIVAHNPFCRELWEWHPKRAQLNLIVYPWVRVKENHEIRTINNIPPDVYPPPCSDKPEIYPSPEDLQVLDVLSKTERLKPFVVISAVAGEDSRNISQYNLGLMVPYLQEKGYDVVAVGRSFKRMFGKGDEFVYGFNQQVISLIDKLTIPGTMKLLEQAAIVISCHSSVPLMNWFTCRKPSLVFYPSKIAKEDIHEVDNKIIKLDTEDCYTFGRKFPETQVCFNENFNLAVLDRML